MMAHHEEHPLLILPRDAEEDRGGGFVTFVRSFENWGCRLAAHRPGDLSQCHSEEPFGHAQDKLRDEESACYLFRGGSKT
jgi:hypothetical protein